MRRSEAARVARRAHGGRAWTIDTRSTEGFCLVDLSGSLVFEVFVLSPFVFFVPGEWRWAADKTRRRERGFAS